jgi:hypothetical protein
MEQSRIATGEEVVVIGFTLYRVGVRCRGQSSIRKNQAVEQTGREGEEEETKTKMKMKLGIGERQLSALAYVSPVMIR